MKILMIADSLDIGGMETHVETLTGALRGLGVEIVIATSGGKIAKRMKKDGFKVLPLPDMRPGVQGSVPSSLRLLQAREVIARYIDAERPNIVHTHTRRASFVAKSLCKKRKIPLICTAHAKFSMNRPRDLLSVWGDAAICVSEDIKEHLFSQPTVAKKDIKVINNGINIPNSPHLPNFKERKIVFVSRLDADCSLGAHLLCEIALNLHKKFPNLQITIVGGGSEYKKISQKVKIINKKINRELMKMTGAVENPSDFFKGSSLFVGVSRAALEAMAHSLPVLLIGNEGYLGLLDKNTLPEAIRTNFTCRKSTVRTNCTVSPYDFFDEICRYFDMPENEKLRLAHLSREIVTEHYSADKMARETLNFYKTVLQNAKKMNKPIKITLCGYYGRGNFGDEAILSVLLDKISKVMPRGSYIICILKSKNPAQIITALSDCDVFIFGGGSLLQNATSSSSLFYYLAMIGLANQLCKCKIMLANGIGPIESTVFVSKNKIFRALARVIDSFDFISARDLNSQKILKNILPHRKIYHLPDPVFAIANEAKNNQRSIKLDADYGSFYVYIPCRNGLLAAGIDIALLARNLAYIEKAHAARVRIVILNENEDLLTAQTISKMMGGVEIVIPKAPSELTKALTAAKFVISQRYHGALFAAFCNLPVIAVSSDPKMHSLCNELLLDEAVSPEILTCERNLCEKIDSALDHCLNLGAQINEDILKKSAQTNSSLEKIIKKFCFPIDKDEQMFYNVKNKTKERETNGEQRAEKRDNSGISQI